MMMLATPLAASRIILTLLINRLELFVQLAMVLKISFSSDEILISSAFGVGIVVTMAIFVLHLTTEYFFLINWSTIFTHLY